MNSKALKHEVTHQVVILPAKLDWSMESWLKILGYALSVALTNFFMYVGKAVEYGNLSKPLMNTLAILLLLDTITGVWAVKRLRRDNPEIKLTSSKAKSGILYKVMMLVILVGAADIIKYAGMDSRWMTTTVVSTLIMAEAYSLLGNMEVIRTGKKVEEVDVITLLIQAVRERLKKIIQATINLIKNGGTNKDDSNRETDNKG